jgi:hypothetical protein
MNYLTIAKDWAMDRVGERTSWDGFSLILVCGLVILAKPIVGMVAWLGLAYGIYTLVTKED